MTDASGVPTSPDNIPTLNTSADAPSGLGFNTAMAAIQSIITNLKAGTLASGKILASALTGLVPTANLGTGAASNAVFLRGDQVWAAPAATSTVIRGTVSSAGAVVLGTGFTSARSSTGVYTVTFTSAFAATPIVVAAINGSPFISFGSFNGVSTSSFTFQTWNSSSVAADAPFSFIAYQV